MGLLLFLIIFALVGLVVLISSYSNIKSENENLHKSISTYSHQNDQLRKQVEETKKFEIQLVVDTKKLTEERKIFEETKKNKIKEIVNEIDKNITDRITAYHWLAPLVADIKMMVHENERPSDGLIKTKRSWESQAKVAVIQQEKKELLSENLSLKYQLEYLRSLIPDVDEIVEYEEEKDKSKDDDNPYRFLTKQEYMELSDTEKNKRALEYYKSGKRNKSKWEIGRDFEMYVGYKCETQGYKVQYFGIEKKLNDLGRDLIIEKDNVIKILQCKYWSKNKTIHEKHIMQLYGTLIKYKIDNPTEKRNIEAEFVTHTILSDTAMQFAKALNIEVKENIKIGDYPMIKCNVNKSNGVETRIYHLPMDQQYDNIKINPSEGDFYALTIEEAEGKCFRRAYRWHGGSSNTSWVLFQTAWPESIDPDIQIVKEDKNNFPW